MVEQTRLHGGAVRHVATVPTVVGPGEVERQLDVCHRQLHTLSWDVGAEIAESTAQRLRRHFHDLLRALRLTAEHLSSAMWADWSMVNEGVCAGFDYFIAIEKPAGATPQE